MKFKNIAEIYNITSYLLYLSLKGDGLRKVIQERLRLKMIDRVNIPNLGYK